ncbi:MAG: recombinase family protein [Ruminococcaceae bacterium]|nr:recombinase family protein [Oscillospiraceae bacterium]
MKAVIYARYSSDSQREESIDGQIRECTEYAERNGITILGSYVDRALSARTDDRPDFQRMIADSEKRLFDIVLVWKLDRFSRDRYDSAHYKHILKKNGVRVMSVKENISDGPEGIILESLLEGMAEYYSAELSVKVTRGHTENALKCKYNGGTLTFGYRIDEDKHYQLNPETAPVVLEIFEMYDSGITMQKICDYLNEKGVKSVRGKNIDLNFIRGILHNPRYKGEYVYRDIVIPGGIPQIVSPELYDSVQYRIATSRKATGRRTDDDAYIFTTKLFCGTCKSYMVGESGTSCTGNKYHYYRCVNTKKKKLCDAKHKSIRKDKLEEVVIGHIKKMLMDDGFVNYLATKAFELQEKESSELPLLRKQLEETEKGIENMLNAIQAGILNDSTKKRLDDLEVLKSELEASIIKEEIRKPTYTFEQIYFYIMSFRDVDTDTVKGRKTLVDHFVNSIVVYDDKILINLNYKKGSKQISFKEIENSGLSSGLVSSLGPSSEKLKSLIYNGFSFFHFRYFYPLDIIWTLFSEKQAFSPCFKRLCEQKQDITQSGFHCRVMSLFNFKYLCD